MSAHDLGSINVSTFFLSLGSAALIALGDTPDPETKKIQFTPELAKQNIEILAMLMEKTKGNLTKDESDLLANLLTDLRLKYVKRMDEMRK